MAKVTLSFGAWPEGKVAPSQHEVSIVSPKSVELLTVSAGIIKELIHPDKTGRFITGIRFAPDGKRRAMTERDLMSLREIGSAIDGHPNPVLGFPFFDAATGSLGQGLSVAAGLRCAARVDGVLQPAEVARMVIEAMEAERFLILSHEPVAEYIQRKASSRDRWLTGMRRLRDKIYGAPQSA